MLNLLSIFFCSAVTDARPLLRAERGARTSAWRTARTRADRAPVRGVKTVLPKPGDAGVTGIAACDGNDGVLARIADAARIIHRGIVGRPCRNA